MPLSVARLRAINFQFSNLEKSGPRKVRKTGGIFGGQNPKNAKKFFKNFIVPKRSLGHTDPIDTYLAIFWPLFSRKNDKK